MHLPEQRILITGASGFLGRHVVSRLWQAGCRNLVKPRRAEFDLTREADVQRLVVAARPHLVIHLAARVGGIGANRRQPGTFAYENLIMGARLIEECRRAGVSKFVLAGTICSYPKHTPAPFRETDLWAGYPEETNAPYGLAKMMLMVQLQAYRQEFGFRSAFLMLANLYGPGDRADLEGHGLDRGEVLTLPTVADESVWAAYEAARQGLRTSLAAGQPAPRYRQPADTGRRHLPQ